MRRYHKKMAGPIIAGSRPWLGALVFIVVVFFACMFMTPETTNIFLQKFVWLGWLINWGRHLFGLPPL
jgi:hypothetical protein